MALASSSIGSNNIAFGQNAGLNFSGSSSNNIAIGLAAGPSTATDESNKLYIASGSGTPLIKGDFAAKTVNISGSLTATSLTGSLLGTASNAVTSSYVLNAVSSSFATTASYVQNAQTASFVQNAQTASYVQNAVSASYAANGGVTQLLAGPNISLSPTNGLGQVTVSSTPGGGGFNTATGSYGSFYSTQTQTNVAGTAQSMSLNTTDITNGISISGSTNPYNTYIKTENAGIYDIQFSAQVDKTDSGTDEIWIWIRKNGTNLSDTATSVQLTGNGAHYVAAWNFFVNAAANDYFQLMWYSPDANVRLHAEPAFGIVPGIPSLIVTANRVDQFLSNTGSFSGSFTGNFTGSLLGTATTASYVLNAVSSSFASTASFFSGTVVSASFAQTASFVTGSIFTSTNPALSASYALTASHALNGGGSSVIVKDEGSTLTSALTSLDFVGSGVTATNVGNDVTITIAGAGGSAFPFTGSALITGSLGVTGSITATSFTGLLLGTASFAVTSLTSTTVTNQNFAIAYAIALG